MPKKSKKKARVPTVIRPTSSGTGRPRRKRYYAAALCALVLLAASAAAMRYDAVRRTIGLRPLIVEPTQSSAQLPLSKEYIYAGGRLVATEEPTATPTPTLGGPPPTNLSATLHSVSPPAATITVSWTEPAGAISYVVERASTAGQFAPVGEPVAAPATSFNDATASEGAAYLYRVKALYAGGPSDYSNQDLATAVAFTDSQLQGFTIKAVHLTELRRAVNAVRTLAGMGAAAWAYPDPVSSPASQRRAIYLEDVTDLRVKLDEAMGQLGLTTGFPANPTLEWHGRVYADHFEQIRQRVK